MGLMEAAVKDAHATVENPMRVILIHRIRGGILVVLRPNPSTTIIIKIRFQGNLMKTHPSLIDAAEEVHWHTKMLNRIVEFLMEVTCFRVLQPFRCRVPFIGRGYLFHKTKAVRMWLMC
ncbi:hypothetical protein KC19_VG318400 [Ceratodon purpureus]|uniref:Uncharacterized protein n=1 Tax=Ceratodon purpureus TaxID=3225 RepID=A0A8T0HVK9_CERPU|nr:hypothetical protein KC19_VG318400 [Ceratodon purpureus]